MITEISIEKINNGWLITIFKSPIGVGIGKIYCETSKEVFRILKEEIDVAERESIKEK